MMLDVGDPVTVDDEVVPPGPVTSGPEASPGGGGGGGSGGGDVPPTATGAARQRGTMDLRNSWQVIAGSILIPLGVIFIMIGWYGAAHARVVQQQIPYLVSGSFIGLGCMVVGGLLYWGHWLYRIYDQADLHHEEQLRVLEQIAASLAVGTTGVAGARATDVVEGGVTGTSTYYATASGTVYHRGDCAVIAHHPDDLRVISPAGRVGLRPCQICSPV